MLKCDTNDLQIKTKLIIVANCIIWLKSLIDSLTNDFDLAQRQWRKVFNDSKSTL